MHPLVDFHSPASTKAGPRSPRLFRQGHQFNTSAQINHFADASKIHHRNSSSQMMTIALIDSALPSATYEAPKHDAPSTPPSSFSSIVSLQALTSWWSPRSTADVASLNESIMSVLPSKPAPPAERRYVSKDKQLEKLRSRLGQERHTKCIGNLQVDVCRTCRTGEVCL